jgi:hypothetical protein
MKWLGQVIKAGTITSLIPLKIFNGDGNDLLAKGSAEIVMLAVVVSAFPTLITGVNFAIERIAAPISVLLQGLVFSVFTVAQGHYVIGVLAGLTLILIMLVIPILVLLYLYSLPLYLMDSLPQLLSLNLSVGGMNSNLSEIGQMTKAAGMVALGNSTNGKPTTPTPPNPEGPAGEGGGGEEPPKGNSGGDVGKAYNNMS